MPYSGARLAALIVAARVGARTLRSGLLRGQDLLMKAGELVFRTRGAESRSVSGFSKWKDRLDEASDGRGW